MQHHLVVCPKTRRPLETSATTGPLHYQHTKYYMSYRTIGKDLHILLNLRKKERVQIHKPKIRKLKLFQVEHLRGEMVSALVSHGEGQRCESGQ